MEVRAGIRRCWWLVACVWAAVLLVVLPSPPLAVCLASALILIGRLLGAADQVSSERFRRAMVVAGGIATVALVGCRIAEAWAPGLPLLVSGALSVVALLGLICLAVGEGVPERPLFALFGALILACAPLLCPSVPALAARLALEALAFLALLVVWRSCRSKETGAGDVGATLSSLAARPLSARELDVLARTLHGEARPQISEALGIAESTVGTLRSRGYEKLGVSSKDELERLVRAAAGPSGEKDAEAAGNLVRRVAGALCAMVLPMVALLSLAAPHAAVSISICAGATLSSASLACFLLLPLDTGGARAIGTSLGGAPTWEHGLVTALCAALVPVLVVSSGMRCVAGLLILFLALAFLGSGAVRPGVKEPPARRVARLLEVGAQEVACRVSEVSGIMGTGLLICSQDVAAGLALGGPGPLDGAWLLVVLLAVLDFGRVFGPGGDAEPGSDALAVELLRERGLNETQVKVALCIADGLGEREVCERLHLARGTVKSYRSLVYRTFGVHGAAELREALRMPARSSRA